MLIRSWSVLFVVFILELVQVFSQQCPTLSNPKGGRVRLRARGRLAKFRCYRKYQLYGPKLLICTGDKWNQEPPICIRPGCDDLDDLSPGLLLTMDMKDAVAKFKCEVPLNLIGEKLLTCNGKAWSAEVPSCEFKEPDPFCGFEDDNLCGWQQDITAKHKWIWHVGTTPTRQTGPTYDHTLGKSGNGHYMFMESSNPVIEGDSVRLLSPYYGSTEGGKCFEFWYHMFGEMGPGKVGKLAVYIEEMKEDKVEMFTISGYQGDGWIKGDFYIGERKNSFRIVMEGTKMGSYLGDIAFDDTRLYNCTQETTVAAVVTTNGITTESIKETTRPPIQQTTEPTDSPTTITDKTTTVPDKTGDHSTSESLDSTAVSTTTKLRSTRTESLPSKTAKPTMRSTLASTLPETTVFEQGMESPESTLGIETSTTKTESTTRATTKVTTNQKPPTQKITSHVPKTTTPLPETTTLKTTLPFTTEVTSKSTTLTSNATEPTETSTMSATKITTQATTFSKLTYTTAEQTSLESITTESLLTESPTVLSTKKTVVPKPQFSTGGVKETTKATPNSLEITDNFGEMSTQNIDNVSSKLKQFYVTTEGEQVTMSEPDNKVTSASNHTTGDNSVAIFKPADGHEFTPVKPLMIGVGVGIAIGLIIVVGAIYIYMKKRRKHDLFEEEMTPIAKNAVYD